MRQRGIITIIVAVVIVAVLVCTAATIIPSMMNQNNTTNNTTANNTTDNNTTTSDGHHDQSTASSHHSGHSGPGVVSEDVYENYQAGDGSHYRQVEYSDGNFRQYDTKSGKLIGSSYESDQKKLPDKS